MNILQRIMQDEALIEDFLVKIAMLSTDAQAKAAYERARLQLKTSPFSLLQLVEREYRVMLQQVNQG